MISSALFTDYYELTMAQGYWKHGLNKKAVFDMFFRRQPFKGGFSVFAGLDTLLNHLENFRFSQSDLEWLSRQGCFDNKFIQYLEDFRFSGDVYSMTEGEIIFPQEPIVRIHSNLIEAQIVEGLILNTINFQSLIATKAARVVLAAKDKPVMEFGLRRAQGYDGAMSATRATYIGGVSGTANTLAAKDFGIKPLGTMAHSWIMAFPNELEAFEAYAEMYPDNTTILIDTYDTLGSGLPKAIEVGKKLDAKGKRFGVRLDSGDIDYLSRKVRAALDAAGLNKAFITVSNELDEEIIEQLVSEKAPIDMWGVGTHLVTGGHEASFTGVYKLAAVERDGKMEATMKFSDNPEKRTNPGIKNCYRLFDEANSAIADILMLEDEEPIPGKNATFYHTSLDTRRFNYTPGNKIKKLHSKVMENGKRLYHLANLDEARDYRAKAISSFDHTYLRFLNPHIYKVSMSEKLRDLKLGFVDKYICS